MSEKIFSVIINIKIIFKEVSKIVSSQICFVKSYGIIGKGLKTFTTTFIKEIPK